MSEFHLQIVTPDGVFFDGMAESVVVRGVEGDLAILKNHIKLVTLLGIGKATVKVNGEKRIAAHAGGFINAGGDEVKIVANTFEWAEDIDSERAKRAKAKAEERLRIIKDKKEAEAAEIKLKRALNRLRVSDNI